MPDHMTWKVGRLASASGVTVRMLHHWDAIGVLSPSRRGAAGHREYSDDDVERLYLIVTLRGFGLDLASVKACLDAGVDTGQVVRDHLRQLDESLAALQQSRRRVAELAARLSADAAEGSGTATDNDGRGDVLLGILREVAGADPDVVAALPDHLDDQRIEALSERVERVGPLATYLIGVEWPHLYRQVDALRRTGAAPDDPRVLPLVRRMQQLSATFNGGDETTSVAVRQAWRASGPWEDLATFVDAARAVVQERDHHGV